MKQIITILLLVFTIPLLSYAQVKKKSKNKYIYISTAVNYLPPLEPYFFTSSTENDGNRLLLTYLHSNFRNF